MKNFLMIISFLFGFTVAASEENAFSKGIKAHSEQLYDEAAMYFLEAIKEDSSNISAFYNFGLSSIGNKSYGKAIWAFESVLKFKPYDLQAQEKIEYCYEHLNSSNNYSPLLNGFSSILYSFNSNTWSILAILFSIVAAGSIILWKLNKIKSFSKVLIALGITSFIICLASMLLAKSTYEYTYEQKNAIVISPDAPTYYDSESISEITLDEGTRLSVLSFHSDSLIEVLDPQQKKHLLKSSEVWLF